MKLQFKHQKFQADAAAAVCDIFRGQGRQSENFTLQRDDEIKIGTNTPIELGDEQILKNLRGVQSRNSLSISERLEGRNFSIEMETGVGKTYTYIKTMYELNKNYGWSKFIIVVPSVAIREGVKKSFEMTEEHFSAEYGEKIRHFVYSSKNLSVIKSFVSDSKIWAMIVNVQAFNSRSADARRMLQPLDEFQSQIPIEIIAQINPIIIIDEPQSVEGETARKNIPKFNPLMILRYSATHRNLYNLVYRLDALDAYQKRLVKKISVKGIEIRGGNSAGYIFFEAINLSKNNPTATLVFNRKVSGGVKKIAKKISVGNDLYKLSNELDEYKNNFIVTEIDGAENSIEFLNGLKLFAGQVIGDVDEATFRRIQIRETIQSHLEREAQLFGRGIKVLSLFFIDEVAKYRQYDAQNSPTAGLYAKIFEEEYSNAAQNFQAAADYKKYLESISAQETHAGYFSVDKKNRAANSKIDDVDAYDLIMRDKERLLDFQTPVRFIFSHSALREGWDNPNVFQICTLKQSSSDIRRRQEVGRGMRLCVNLRGERMDEDKIGDELHEINVLTVIANESYQTFAAGLQSEIAEAVNRQTVINEQFFIGKKIAGQVADEKLSRKIYHALIRNDYLNDDGNLTEKFSTDTASGKISLGEELEPTRAEIVKSLSFDYKIENARDKNVEIKLDEQKLNAENFRELWSRISRKGFYSADFDSAELISTAAKSLDKNLSASESYLVIERGTLNDAGIFDKNLNGTHEEYFQSAVVPFEKDLVGKLVAATGLTRLDVAEILKNSAQKILEPIKINPEKFLANAADIINGVIAAQVSDNIKYTATDERFDIKIFSVTAKGRLDFNAMATSKNLYDHLIYDSKTEKEFAADLESAASVSVYVKLPKSFRLPTPAGEYTPDWAIVFSDKIYLVVETKGSDDEMQLRGVEKIKTSCARKYFDEITGGKVKYRVTKNCCDLIEKGDLK